MIVGFAAHSARPIVLLALEAHYSRSDLLERREVEVIVPIGRADVPAIGLRGLQGAVGKIISRRHNLFFRARARPQVGASEQLSGVVVVLRLRP